VSKSEKKKKKNGKKKIFFLFSLKNTKVTALSVRCLRVFSLSLSRPVPSLRHRRSGAASSRAVKRVEKRKKMMEKKKRFLLFFSLFFSLFVAPSCARCGAAAVLLVAGARSLRAHHLHASGTHAQQREKREKKKRIF
jgi:hypothetical protein